MIKIALKHTSIVSILASSTFAGEHSFQVLAQYLYVLSQYLPSIEQVNTPIVSYLELFSLNLHFHFKELLLILPVASISLYTEWEMDLNTFIQKVYVSSTT